MKRVVLVVMALSLLAMPALAGDFLSKGMWQVGGNAHFTTSGGDAYEDGNGDGSTSFGINPQIGKFFMDNLVAGIGFNFASTSQGDNSNGDLDFGPYLEYYFMELGGGNLYGHFAFMYNADSFDNGTTDGTNTTTRIRLGAGWSMPLAGNVAFTPELFYSMDTFTPDGGDGVSGNVMGLSAGIKVYVEDLWP